MPDNPPERLRHVRSRTEQGVVVLTVTEPQLHGDKLVHTLRQELLAAAARPEVHHVVLDLQPVKTLSSEAFRPLLSLRRAVQERGGQLVLCNLAPAVAKMLHDTRLITTGRSTTAPFEVQPDVAAAVASLNKAAEEQ